MNNSPRKLLPAKNKLIVAYSALSTLCASLMMSPEEMGMLDKISPIDDLGLFESTDSQSLPTANIEQILFLSAILYFAPTHWTIWINDKTYTPDHAETESLKIVRVTSQQIELELKDQTKKVVKLRSNQSFVMLGHQIVEGDARPKPAPTQL